MARYGSEPALKKDSKLEAFLKRNLDVSCAERIRASESCIVCSEREDKAFKYVVLSDEWLYLAENPPKKLQEAVHLRDIVSVELVSDFPEFLSGEERENTQHIVITYLTDEATKGKRKAKKEEELDEAVNGLKTPRSARGISARASLSVSGHVTHRGMNNRVKSWSSQSARETSGVRERRVQFQNDASPQMARKVSKLVVDDLRRSNSIDSDMWKQMLQNGSKKQKKAKEKNRKLEGRELPQFPQEIAQRRPSKPPNIPELKLDLEGICGSDEEEEVPPTETKQHLLMLPSLRERSQSSESLVSGKGSCGTDSEEDDGKLREGRLHLYILSKSSPILMFTKCAWKNYLLRNTLEMDPDFVCRTVSFGTPRKSQDNKEKLELLFRQLKTEILTSDDDLEEVFNLVTELRNGAERNSLLKKLFWKTPELFKFLIKQLHLYLPESPNMGGLNDDEAKEARADELELVILIAETIGVMFRETEIVPSRLNVLNSGAGEVARSLMKAVIVLPEVPLKRPMISSKLLGSSLKEQQKCLGDIELTKLLEEYTNAATTILFEMLLMAHQNNWSDSESSVFNITWMVKSLTELDTMENFVERMVGQVMHLLSPSRFDELTPVELVLVFQQFTVLQALMEYSSVITEFVRKHFYEEFKYYIQTPILKKKLSSRYLLTPYILRLIEKVLSEILQKQMMIS